MWDQRSVKSNSIRDRGREMGSEGRREENKQVKINVCARGRKRKICTDKVSSTYFCCFQDRKCDRRPSKSVTRRLVIEWQSSAPPQDNFNRAVQHTRFHVAPVNIHNALDLRPDCVPSRLLNLTWFQEGAEVAQRPVWGTNSCWVIKWRHIIWPSIVRTISSTSRLSHYASLAPTHNQTLCCAHQGLKAMACQTLDSASANSLPILDNEQDREIKDWWQGRL